MKVKNGLCQMKNPIYGTRKNNLKTFHIIFYKKFAPTGAGKATTTVAKVTAKSVAIETVKAVGEGLKTGAAETATKSIVSAAVGAHTNNK
jgi:hypothetical protein